MREWIYVHGNITIGQQHLSPCGRGWAAFDGEPAVIDAVVCMYSTRLTWARVNQRLNVTPVKSFKSSFIIFLLPRSLKIRPFEPCERKHDTSCRLILCVCGLWGVSFHVGSSAYTQAVMNANCCSLTVTYSNAQWQTRRYLAYVRQSWLNSSAPVNAPAIAVLTCMANVHPGSGMI